MHKTILLSDLIAQLQAVESNNPGTQCALDDHEWGIGEPQLEMVHVYTSKEDGTINKVTQDEYEMSLQSMKAHEATTAKVVWGSWTEEERLDYAQYIPEGDDPFENFERSSHQVYEYNKRMVENYESRYQILTISLK